MAIHNSAPQDSIKITKSNFFKKLCLTVGIIISIICIFIFGAFIGNSVCSYDEDTIVRNSPSKLYIKVGHLLSEPRFDPHSTSRFQRIISDVEFY